MANAAPLVRARRVDPLAVVRALRGHELAARLALASFFWATVLGPALHLVDHRDDHVHGAEAAGTHRHAPGMAVHRHGAGSAGATPVGSSAPVRDGTALGREGAGSPASPVAPHGRGDALHFGLALLEAIAAAPLPPPRPSPELAVAGWIVAAPPGRPLAAHPARGPPPV